MAKARIFSGVQPTGNLHLGNYLGAIELWLSLQNKYDCIFSVVDYHAITVSQEPRKLKESILAIAKIMLASGINPDQSVIFQQSALSAHTELAWILNCTAHMGELKKMTQFKEKSAGQKDIVSLGLFAYPVLMAADILLYQTEAVPVGEDQSQHVELARDLARRFNHQFGQTFMVPDLITRPDGARIMGLDDPRKKMSKSAASEYNYIALLDEPDKAAKKIMKAVTDSGQEIKFAPANKPAISNLLTIYSLLSGRTIARLEEEYQGRQYGALKKDLAEAVKIFLSDFQSRLNEITDAQARQVLSAGAAKIAPLAESTLRTAKERLGLTLNNHR